ncbi:MAG: response regulator transcription factor [Pyrinomonadaceae bacterium]|nr:response regulator transcription factor [Pyrinomonadaceae bacterium]
MKILLVEDEEGLIFTLTDRLISEGYKVTTARDGEAGLNAGLNNSFDVIILDIMLPKKNGFDVCRELRAKGIFTPILMLTAKGETIDKVVGLKLGADDYLTKPFEIIELLARIEALLRRSTNTIANSLESYSFGDIEIDFRRAEVKKSGIPLDLSAMEFKILQYFIEHRGEVLKRDELLDEVWGYDAMPTTRTVDVHIAWLRQKLEENPRYPVYIQTVHGFGYKFTA